MTFDDPETITLGPYASPILPAPRPFTRTFIDALDNDDVSSMQPLRGCGATLSPIRTTPIPFTMTLVAQDIVDVRIGTLHLYAVPSND